MITEKVADLLASRLSPFLPQSISLSASGSSLRLRFAVDDVETIAFDEWIQTSEPDRQEIGALLLAALSQAQDAIAGRLRMPWPDSVRMPNPKVIWDKSHIHLGFVADNGEFVVKLESIPWIHVVT